MATLLAGCTPQPSALDGIRARNEIRVVTLNIPTCFYFGAQGNLEAFPFAALIRDCICNSGSEVILTTNLLGGGVYRVSVFNFGDQAANSNNLSNLSNATITIVRGGVATGQGSGTTIVGGRTILTTQVPNGRLGNTWVAAERWGVAHAMPNLTGRIPDPEDIGRVVAFVAGEPAWHVNGAELHIKLD